MAQLIDLLEFERTHHESATTKVGGHICRVRHNIVTDEWRIDMLNFEGKALSTRELTKDEANLILKANTKFVFDKYLRQ